MRIPQTPERIKEAPAQALRAVFAGVGQVLLITERGRRRATGPDADAAGGIAAAAAPPESPHIPAQAASPAAEQESAPAAAQPAAPAEAAVPAQAAEPEQAPASPVNAAAGEASLPLPSYSELSIASLRARMRGLDTGQVRELLDFEKAHENRANVTAMFERRIAKLAESAGDGTA